MAKTGSFISSSRKGSWVRIPLLAPLFSAKAGPVCVPGYGHYAGEVHMGEQRIGNAWEEGSIPSAGSTFAV